MHSSKKAGRPKQNELRHGEGGREGRVGWREGGKDRVG